MKRILSFFGIPHCRGCGRIISPRVKYCSGCAEALNICTVCGRTARKNGWCDSCYKLICKRLIKYRLREEVYGRN